MKPCHIDAIGRVLRASQDKALWILRDPFAHRLSISDLRIIAGIEFQRRGRLAVGLAATRYAHTYQVACLAASNAGERTNRE